MKKYASYAEIESDLQILKLQKEIHYQKMMGGILKTKESLSPPKMVHDMLGAIGSTIANPYVAVLTSVAPFLLTRVMPFIKKWISKKEGGE